MNPKYLSYSAYIKIINKIEAIKFFYINTIRRVFESYGKTYLNVPYNPYFLRRDNDYCMVVKTNDKNIICFRGSNDLQDWISNLWFFKKINDKKFKSKNKFGLHGGFLHSASKFKNDIFEVIDPNKDILIIGHSRGGALGIFTAMFLYKKFGKPVELMSFGTPCVLGSEFRNMFNKMNIHYVNVRNHRDFICQMGKPLFKDLGIIKVLPVPFLWNFNFIKRHKEYYENIKRIGLH